MSEDAPVSLRIGRVASTAVLERELVHDLGVSRRSVLLSLGRPLG